MAQRQKPRRTIDLLDPLPSGSTSRPSMRISRIAQPIRKSYSNKRSLERSISCERLSTAKLNLPTSTCKRQRSISATPQRTPRNNITHNPGILLTLEKAPIYDKKWLQIESNHINDYLKNIENLLGEDFFYRGGIKSMSTKQFITIVQYFTKKICGNRLTIGNNHVESIANILTKIQYPYTINKSWLKTPCAPHAFNNVVLLFNWFILFDNNKNNSTRKTFTEFEEYFIISGNLFPDKKYAIEFLIKTREAFILWNNGSEHKYLQQELKDNLISKRIDLKNTYECEQDINRLKFEIDEIIIEMVEINKKQNEFNKFDGEVKMKNKKIKKLDDKCKDNDKQIEQLNLEVEEQENLIKDVQARIEDIEKNILKQKMTISERNDFIKELNELNYELKTREKSIIDLQDITNKNQIILSRLIRKKTDLIRNFNTHIYTIFNDIDNLKNLNIEEFCLEKTSTDYDIDKIENLLTKISKENIKNIENYTNELKELENELSILVYKHDSIIIPKYESNKIKLHNYEEQVNKINIELINVEEKFNDYVDELNKNLNNLKLCNSEMVKENKVKKCELFEIKHQNEKMWLKLEKRLGEIIEYRENRIKKLNNLVDDFNEVIDEVRLSLKDIL